MSDPYSQLVTKPSAAVADPYAELLPKTAVPAQPAEDVSAAPVETSTTTPAEQPKSVYDFVPTSEETPVSTKSSSSILSYVTEGMKAVGAGAVGTFGSYLQGKAAVAGRPERFPGEGELEYNLRVLEWEEKPSELPIAENPLYKAGSALNNIEALQRGKEWSDSFYLDVMGGFGSVGSAIGVGLATGPLAPLFGAELFMNAGRGEAAERAIKAGATEEQIRRASSLATLAGATDLVDLMLLNMGGAGKVGGFIKRVGVNSVKAAFAEGGQEGLQQFIQNAIAKGVYKPDQDLMEEVPKNFLVGAIVGGSVRAATSAAEKQSTPASTSDLGNAYNELVGTPIPQADPELAPGAPPTPPAPISAPAFAGPSAWDELINKLPKNPTEEHFRESSPLLPDADSTIAEMAPQLMDPPDAHPLRSSILGRDLIPDPIEAPSEQEVDTVDPNTGVRLSVASESEYPPNYFEIVPTDMRISRNGVSHPGYRWEVYDPQTKKIFSTHESAPRARAAADRRDNSYGGYRYKTRRVLAETLHPEEEQFLREKGLYDHLRPEAQTRLNTQKLTPRAASRFPEIDRKVNELLRSLSAEKQRDLVIRAIALAAGREAAGRSVVKDKLPNVVAHKDWGGGGQMMQLLGSYSPGRDKLGLAEIIKVSLAHGPVTALQTAFHESWHAIEATLTRQEVELLFRDTENLRRWLSERNPQQAELYARAEATEIWADTAAFSFLDKTWEKAGYIAPQTKTVFQKIHQFLQRVRNYLQGLGFQTAGDIFEAYYSGEMAERRNAIPTPMLERWWDMETGYPRDLDLRKKMVRDYKWATQRNTEALKKLDSGIGYVQGQLETVMVRKGMDVLFSMTHGAPNTPPTVQQAIAAADQMSWRHKWMWGLDRLVDLNPRFTPLLRYAERIREMRLDATKIQNRGLEIAKEWRSLKQQEELAAFIDDITNMRYRTPVEVARGIRRQPTQQEFQTLVQTHGLGREALAVFAKQKRFFEGFLKAVTQNAIDTANRTILNNPVALANKIVAIQTKEAELLKAPYFPFLRFGKHYVMVKDKSGTVVHFETFERRGVRSAESVQKAAEKRIKAAALAGEVVTLGVLPETAAPFIGLPPELLEAIQNDLAAMPDASGHTPGLTPQQVDAIEMLRYAYSPGSSFAHRFQHKDYTKGYSEDFLRSFSRYAFNGARYYSRVKYGWALRGHIAEARRLGKGASDNKIGSIANFMEDHLYNTVLDAKGDFGPLKAAIFTWVFGFSVIGALVNLSQIPTNTYPFLASRFGGVGLGDARATKAILKAGAQLNNFYKKGFYNNHTQFEMKAIEYGIKTGRITEAQASELAGLAQGNTLLGIGNNKVRRATQKFLEASTFMFEMMEQYNRRLTYRAALDLAMKHPNSRGVTEALNKYADEYNQLVQSGFNAGEAKAVVAAVHATEQTQFVYARENRPRFIRGRFVGTLAVFKTYLIQMLQLMGANKRSMLPRQLIILFGLAGIYGLPGAEDAEDLANWLGKFFYGKSFNLKKQIREWAVELAGDKADVVLHGMARKGFGVPALMDTLGEAPGRGLGTGHSNNVPVPVFDVSRQLSMGRILPVDIGDLMDPLDVNKTVSQQTQKASGAVWGVGFNLYRALFDTATPAGDFKRWERAMPRALAAASRSYRAFDEGRERSRGGPEGAATVVNFDRRDPEQMAEIIGMSLGFTPERLNSRWDEIIMKAEVTKKLQIEQKMVLQNRFEAQMGGRPEEIDRANQAIRDYNSELPEWARGYKITGESLFQSLEARARDKNMKEAGVATQRRDRPVYEYIEKLFPGNVTDVRKVR